MSTSPTVPEPQGVLVRTPSKPPSGVAEGDAKTLPIPSTQSLDAAGGNAGVPAKLGSYRILGPLGGGGMGEVFDAFDEALERPAAVKVIARRYAANSTMYERLQIEARAAARLNHPNIVTIFQLGEDGDISFIAMERLEGKSLSTVIRERGPLPPHEALSIVRQAALGLQHAAQQHVIHRDVKPSNIVVTPDGAAKVLDFGLAKRLDAFDPSLTDTNHRVGTPLYMAPEQASGEDCDHRADIYALGITLYHAVVGKPPFEATSPVAVAMKHATAPLPMTDHLRGIMSGKLAELVEWLGAKDPNKRPKDYAEVIERIDSLLARPADEPVAPPRNWVKIAALAAGFVVMVLVSYGVWRVSAAAQRERTAARLSARNTSPVPSVSKLPEPEPEASKSRRPRIGERLRNGGGPLGGPAGDAVRDLGRVLAQREVLAKTCLEGNLETAVAKVAEAREKPQARLSPAEKMAIADLERALRLALSYQGTLGGDLSAQVAEAKSRAGESALPFETRFRAVVFLLAVAPGEGRASLDVLRAAEPDEVASPARRNPVMTLGMLHGGPGALIPE